MCHVIQDETLMVDFLNLNNLIYHELIYIFIVRFIPYEPQSFFPDL